MKRKACKTCKLLLLADAQECPTCRTAQFVLNWKGRVIVLDKGQSRVAQKMGLEQEGEFAIKAS